MWIYQDNVITELPNDIIGFVYIITNTTNDKKYIGKKLAKFSKISYKIVTLKNGTKKKKKIKSTKESDWQLYYGSCKELLEDINLLGKDLFTRTILHFCYSKGQLSYMELKEQVLNNVLFDNNKWYNGIIQVKIHRNHLK